MTSGVSNVLCIGDTSSVIQIELLFLRNMDPEKNYVNRLYAIPRINFSLNVEKPKKNPTQNWSKLLFLCSDQSCSIGGDSHHNFVGSMRKI